MIFVNGEEVKFTSFPDGTTSFRFDTENKLHYIIRWMYDGDHECILLWYLVKHIKSHAESPNITLILPYVPNARMDRVKEKDEVFTLKWFADFINSMYFDRIMIHDPHSNVTNALLNNVVSISSEREILKVVDELSDKNVILCYPDEGAAKRYSDQIQIDYIFCIKHRDWRTGKIERLELTTPEKVKNRNVLIVDDICSRGGTFTHTAKALKNAGAADIFLYVTRCREPQLNAFCL